MLPAMLLNSYPTIFEFLQFCKTKVNEQVYVDAVLHPFVTCGREGEVQYSIDVTLQRSLGVSDWWLLGYIPLYVIGQYL